jgi:adenylosuccinate lyase
MIPRYAHPAVTRLWSDEWTFAAWLQIESLVLDRQRAYGLGPEAETNELAQALHERLTPYFEQSMAASIRYVERTETHHEVAAFLSWLRSRVGDSGKWLHFGLTSSDLVDTAQAMRFKSLHPVYLDAASNLLRCLARLVEDDTPMLGRTHGQPAEPTSMRARAMHWISTVEHPLQGVSRMTKAGQIMKLSGPVGTFAHNPPELEVDVAVALGLIPLGPGASQIVPRSPLAMWASSAATMVEAMAKIALDLRLLELSEEVSWPRAGKHVGSSAMPHKNNPIEAEQMAGFARLAAGYAAMLQPLGVWLERDISNSSVERVAVPDLWHILLTSMTRMCALLESMETRPFAIKENLGNRASEAWSHKATLDAIRDGESYEDARDQGLNLEVESYDVMGDARWFMRQYPKARA